MVTYPKWESMKLGDLGHIQMCRRIFQNQTKEYGAIPFYKISTFGGKADAFISKELYENYKLLYPYPERGEVLISAAGTIGKAVIFDGKDGYFQDSNIVWLKTDERIDKKYLYWFYRSFPWEALEGTTIQRLYNSIILNTSINLPSIPEQKKIVKTLSAFDEYINNLTELIEKKKNIRDGALEDLVTGKTRLEGYCGEWKENKLDDFIDIKRGASPRPIEHYLTNAPAGINWIKIGDVSKEEKYITKTDEKITESGALKSVRVFSGDFILSNSMSFGRPYILKINGCIHDGWLRLFNFSENADTEFLYYLLSSRYVQEQYISLAAGSGVQNLNKELVKKVEVMLPELKEQQEIAKILSSMDEEITNFEEERDKIIQIRDGVMDDLLTGRVRLEN